MHGLDRFNSKSFQSADVLRKLLSRLNFGLRNDRCIEDHSHIFGTLYYKDIFKCIQFVLAHRPFLAHLDFEPVHLADLESRAIYSEIKTGNWRWDMQDKLPAGATIVPVIGVSCKTHLTNFSGDQHACISKMKFGPEALRKPFRHSGSPR